MQPDNFGLCSGAFFWRAMQVIDDFAKRHKDTVDHRQE